MNRSRGPIDSFQAWRAEIFFKNYEYNSYCVVAGGWESKRQDLGFIRLSLYDCMYHIFKRTITAEVKSIAIYLFFGLNTYGKNYY